MAVRKQVSHTLKPWFDHRSRVLILGTMPSPKSREYGCYYGHPQNRFWKTLASVFEVSIPNTVEDRVVFTKTHHIALWDVLASCEICGADDSSITAPIANDLSPILKTADIKTIFVTGAKAKRLYDTLILPMISREAIALPSTSPANRRWYNDQALVAAYSILREYCL